MKFWYDVGMLLCKTCSQNKPESEFYSRQRKLPNGTYWIGYERECKLCFKLRVTKNTTAKKAQVEQYQRTYRETHRQELNLKAIEYRKQHADEIKVKDAIRKKLPQAKQAAKQYYQNRMLFLKNSPEAYEQHCQKQREGNQAWQKRHPDQYHKTAKLASAKRRAFKHQGNCGSVPGDIESYLRKWQQNRCAYCLQPLGNNPRKVHLDHIVPLTRNGTHSIENLVLSCQSCNIRKSNKLLYAEWLPDHQETPIPYSRMTELDSPIIRLSSFLCQNKTNPNYKKVVEAIRKDFPDLPLFWDFELDTRLPVIHKMLQIKNHKVKTIGARTLQIKAVPRELAREFLQQHHLQGPVNGSQAWGLFQDQELRALSVWKTQKTHHELIRLAFNGHVMGGFSRLLAHFKQQASTLPIVSFADLRYVTGDSYLTVGFQEAGNTKTSVMSYVTSQGILNRQFLMKKRMAECFPHFDPSKTEWENAWVHGYGQLYALPQRKFILPH